MLLSSRGTGRRIVPTRNVSTPCLATLISLFGSDESSNVGQLAKVDPAGVAKPTDSKNNQLVEFGKSWTSQMFESRPLTTPDASFLTV